MVFTGARRPGLLERWGGRVGQSIFDVRAAHNKDTTFGGICGPFLLRSRFGDLRGSPTALGCLGWRSVVPEHQLVFVVGETRGVVAADSQ